TNGTSGSAYLATGNSRYHDQSTIVWSDSNDNVVGTGNQTLVTGLPFGVNTLTLTITGPDNQVATDTVAVTVSLPGADASATQNPPADSNAGATVTLDGSRSVQGASNYQWWLNCAFPGCP